MTILPNVLASLASSSTATKIALPVGNLYSLLATIVDVELPTWVLAATPIATALYIITRCYVAVKKVNHETRRESDEKLENENK